MLSGFNTNFRYRGVLFHVQTEDSGLENPHVISHLFHGGNIMASEKRDYSDLLASSHPEALEGAIRKLMEGQHKSMLKQLSRGEHDPAIEQRMGNDVFRVASQSGTADIPVVTEEELPPPPSPRKPETLSDSSRAVQQPVAALAEQTVLEEQPIASPHELELTEPVSQLARVFGERVVSEKPLDEVVLDYLVENARKRKRSAK
jgi:hypothetical protein